MNRLIILTVLQIMLFCEPSTHGQSVSLTVAGINSVDLARQEIQNIAKLVDDEGPKLIVHSVNWFRYDSVNIERTMGWNVNENARITKFLSSKPLLGYYSCDDPDYMDWLLSVSQALGIDEINIDYEGGVDVPVEFELYYNKRSWDSWFMNLLARAEKFDIKISVMFEPKTIQSRLAMRMNGKGPVLTTDPEYQSEALILLKSDLRKICDRFTVKKSISGKYIMNPVYKRIGGLPVIWVFWMTAGSLNYVTWKKAIEDLTKEGYAFVLVANTYGEKQVVFDNIVQGVNPWLDQLFTGMQSTYPELWFTAQKAAEKGDSSEAKKITNEYIKFLSANGLDSIAPVRHTSGPANFMIAPLAIGFQDADVNAWDLRPPAYFEPDDRTLIEPGKIFRAYFQAAIKKNNKWFMVCSGDDIAEQTNMLIPDEKYGFSGQYAIALASSFLGKSPDLKKAIQITRNYIKNKNNGYTPINVGCILDLSERVLPGKLEMEKKLLTKNK